MNLEYEVKESNTGKKSVRVSFDPPLSGYEEVKPRLLSMTADAQESLGMVCSFWDYKLSDIHEMEDKVSANNLVRDTSRDL